MIIADENMREVFIFALRNANFDVYSIKELNRGFSDISITQLSINPPRIILTRDKDFGDFAFVNKVAMTGCILLRYQPLEENELVAKLLSFLEDKTLETLTNKFVTITAQKIRITEIEF